METAQQVMRNLVSALIAATRFPLAFMISQHKFNLICARDSIPGQSTLCYCIQRRRLAWAFPIIGCEIYRLSPNGEFFCLITSMHSRVSGKVIGNFDEFPSCAAETPRVTIFYFQLSRIKVELLMKMPSLPLFRGCQKVSVAKLRGKATEGNEWAWTV